MLYVDAKVLECSSKFRSDHLQLTRLPGLDGLLNVVPVHLEALQVLIIDLKSLEVEHH